jgi:glycosyltransferase involved in cell wall biosynthesis
MERSFVVGEIAAAVSRLATALADTVVAVSDGVAEYLTTEQHVPPSKIHVIRNGFDFERLTEDRPSRSLLRAQLGWQRDHVVIGSLAVLKPRKGLTYLIQAARTVLELHPHARFFIAGEGPARSTLEAHIARLCLRHRVHLLGQRNDPLALLEASDIFVLPSLFEGLPRALLEAMALAKPVVATDIGGSREVVRHEETGLIVAPRDAEALAQSLSRLVASPRDRRAYGEAGRRAAAREFSARRVALAHEAVYDALNKKGSASGAVRSSGRATRR